MANLISITQYLASSRKLRLREDRVFHHQDCGYVSRLRRPAQGYPSRADAVKDNCRPCLKCRP